MDNVLLRLFRLQFKFCRSTLASKLEIDLKDYLALEKGDLSLTLKQAQVLSKLYNVKIIHLLESARQLELLKVRQEIIQQLQLENSRLNHLMEGGYELIHRYKNHQHEAA